MRILRPSPDPVRADAEQATFDNLKFGDFKSASVSVAEFQAKQPVPSGLGVDWENHKPGRDVAALESIFLHVPGILGELRTEAVEPLRLGAGMIFLWGHAPPRRIWLLHDLDTGTQLSADNAALMFVFYAYGRQNLRAYDVFGGGPALATISSCPSPCRPCAALRDRAHTTDDAPELPYPECTNASGCRCSYMISRR